jgi:hypothetical protein
VDFFIAKKMAKDPAFLFYHQDFFTGVCDMTNEEVGAYIRCLCVQASKGGISEKHMKNICNSHEVHNSVKSKFIFDAEANIFFNERLKSEIEKRKKYSESRSANRKNSNKSKSHMKNISKTYVEHMENEDENENEIENEKEKAPAKKPIAEWMELFPFKSQEAIKAMEDYISHRKQLRVKPYTAIGLKQAMAEWDRWGEAVFIEAVYNSIKNNWQGIFLPHKNQPTNGNNNQRTNGRIEPAPHGADFGKFGA